MGASGRSFSYPSDWPLIYISSGGPPGTGHSCPCGTTPHCSPKVPAIAPRLNVRRLSFPVISQTLSTRHLYIRHEVEAVLPDTCQHHCHNYEWRRDRILIPTVRLLRTRLFLLTSLAVRFNLPPHRYQVHTFHQDYRSHHWNIQRRSVKNILHCAPQPFKKVLVTCPP